MLYHLGMTDGKQGKTVTVRANRLGDAQEAALRASPGFRLTGEAAAEEEPQEVEVVEADEDDEDE